MEGMIINKLNRRKNRKINNPLTNILIQNKTKNYLGNENSDIITNSDQIQND